MTPPQGRPQPGDRPATIDFELMPVRRPRVTLERGGNRGVERGRAARRDERAKRRGGARSVQALLRCLACGDEATHRDPRMLVKAAGIHARTAHDGAAARVRGALPPDA